MSDHVFISHTSKDDVFVKALREKLESHGIATWVDSRELVVGNKLDPEIETAIDESSSLIAVLSPNAINSRWVSKEIQKALAVEAERQEDGYRVIPVMLPGIEVGALHLWFGEAEPVGLPIQTDVGAWIKLSSHCWKHWENARPMTAPRYATSPHNLSMNSFYGCKTPKSKNSMANIGPLPLQP